MDKDSAIIESELVELKRELSHLEAQLIELTNQKITKEKLIQDYNFKFYSQTGDLLKEVTALRLNKLKQEDIWLMEIGLVPGIRWLTMSLTISDYPFAIQTKMLR